ncbi:MAG: DUF2911 domain-containing protein [Flavobacteriaceae bacterium]|nr:DUF2911 domain-containing protein [Flavobacteriaceae bacterium]
MSKLKKVLLWILGIAIVLFLLMKFAIGPYIISQTKVHSPEKHITFNQNDLELKAFYNSPSKKGRAIFGELVPYNEVWRTGANEASTFTTNKDLLINGKTLPRGTYSLWTIPGEDTWQVIFNSEMYEWGVRFTNQTPSREPEYDVVVATVPSSKSLTVTENFTISFTENGKNTIMILAWDTIVVPVLLQEK